MGFHTLASLLLALMFRRMGLNLELAFLGGLLFLVDVSHFHSVHHISALDFALGLVWGVLAVIFYLRYLATSQRNIGWAPVPACWPAWRRMWPWSWRGPFSCSGPGTRE